MTIPANGRPPFRADHIGSLLRPQALRQAFRAHAAKQMTDVDFRSAQDAAIRDVIKLQEECGLQVVTDGEFRRISYWEKFVRLTQGLVVKDAAFKFHDEHGHESEFTAPYAASKVSRLEPITRPVRACSFSGWRSRMRPFPSVAAPPDASKRKAKGFAS